MLKQLPFTYWRITRIWSRITVWRKKKKSPWKVHLVPESHSIQLRNYSSEFRKHPPSGKRLILYLVVNRREQWNVMSPDTLLALHFSIKSSFAFFGSCISCLKDIAPVSLAQFFPSFLEVLVVQTSEKQGRQESSQVWNWTLSQTLKILSLWLSKSSINFYFWVPQ